MGLGIRAARKLPVVSCQLRVVSYQLSVASCQLPVARAFFRLVKRVMLGAMATLRQPFGIQEAYAWPCLPSAIQHAHASVEHGTRKRVTNLANALVASC